MTPLLYAALWVAADEGLTNSQTLRWQQVFWRPVLGGAGDQASNEGLAASGR